MLNIHGKIVHKRAKRRAAIHGKQANNRAARKRAERARARRKSDVNVTRGQVAATGSKGAQRRQGKKK